MPFLLVFGGFIAFVIYASRKYNNPYKLQFIFGKKGAGKSCYMVRKMLYYLRHGWTVYTDMADVRIPGVRIISVKDLERFRPAPHSAIFLDEVGISMDNRDFKSFPPGLRDFFKYVRKMQCCVFMNSQAYDVDKKVRDTTDSLLLVQSIANIFSLCRPVIRTVTLTQPSGDSDSRIADMLRFSFFTGWRIYYMPFYFRYFDSKSMPSRRELSYSSPVNPDDKYLDMPAKMIVKDVIRYARQRFPFSEV